MFQVGLRAFGLNSPRGSLSKHDREQIKQSEERKHRCLLLLSKLNDENAFYTYKNTPKKPKAADSQISKDPLT